MDCNALIIKQLAQARRTESQSKHVHNLTAWVTQLTEGISNNLAMPHCPDGEEMWWVEGRGAERLSERSRGDLP